MEKGPARRGEKERRALPAPVLWGLAHVALMASIPEKGRSEERRTRFVGCEGARRTLWGTAAAWRRHRTRAAWSQRAAEWHGPRGNRPAQPCSGGGARIPATEESVEFASRQWPRCNANRRDTSSHPCPTQHVPEEQVVGLRGEPAVLEEAQQVIVLPVDVTADLERRLELQERRLGHKHGARLGAEELDLLLLQLDLLPGARAAHLQELVWGQTCGAGAERGGRW